MGTEVGSVAELWRFPVKSMGGERLEEAELTERGLLGDRGYALIDVNTGKVVSAKSTGLFPNVLSCGASFLAAPQLGQELPPVRISFPDGTSVTSDSRHIDGALSSCLEREVTLARVAPDDFTIDQYHPDVENLDPEGHRDTVVEQKLGSALFSAVGLQSPVPEGAFFDLFPVSVMTTSTLTRLRELVPASTIDPRRFRMNVIVATEEASFLENDWVGRALGLGRGRLGVALPDPRCVMTTLAQDGLSEDTDVLRALARHNRIQVGDIGQFPCAGVYAVVEATGPVQTGATVTVD
ncbi:MAG TPA: MOSC domain-containing protein [Vicinamibacterales bacterium]|jgi:hypothetical protein|nr:MOSC domain-containing protein [Vicinamibacterales bacterium]|tara:strand:+ start:88 stop:972 length:885 start_codon:yes stop_codon:yes gene_type:complete